MKGAQFRPLGIGPLSLKTRRNTALFSKMTASKFPFPESCVSIPDNEIRVP